MAVGNWTVYANAKLNQSQAKYNLASDTFVMVLLTASYTPVVNTDATWANASAYEVATGSGYTQGGQVLTSQTDTLSAGVTTFAAAASAWPTFTATFKYAALVRRAAGALASTDLLIAYFDSNFGGGSTVGGGGTLTISNPSGFFTES